MGQWTIRVRCLYFVCSVIFLGTRLPATAKHLARPNRLASHDFVKAVQPQRSGVIFSPDKQYKAKIMLDDETVAMVIYQREFSGEYRPVTGYINDVYGFLWLPGHGHSLVWAACSVYGKAALSRFDGRAGIHPLQRPNDPDSDCYRFYGYLIRRHEIVYGYSEDYYTTLAVDAADARLKKRRYMVVK